MFIAGFRVGRDIVQDLRSFDDELLRLFTLTGPISDSPRSFQLDRVYQFIVVAEEIPGGIIDVSPTFLNLRACVETFEISCAVSQEFMVVNERAAIWRW